MMLTTLAMHTMLTTVIKLPAVTCNVCTLYALLFVSADAYNSVMNAYNTHDATGSS